MAHHSAVVEATPTLRPDMSMHDLLAAVAAGQVVLHWHEPFDERHNMWKGLDGKPVPYRCATSRRLDFLEWSEHICTRLYGGADWPVTELTTTGWHWLERLVRPLTPEEQVRRLVASPPLDPRTVMRWCTGTPRDELPRCFRMGMSGNRRYRLGPSFC